MKRGCIILITFILFAVSNRISAQGFAFGIQPGINMANVSVKGDQFASMFEPNSRLGYHFNLYFGYRSGGSWGLSFEPGLVTKGWDGIFAGQAQARQFAYVNMPVLFNYYILKPLSVSIGPEFAYLADARHIFDGQFWSENRADQYDPFELSGVIGAQYNVLGNLDIGLRHSRAFTPHQKIIFTDQVGNVVETGKAFNNYTQAFLRYRFISGEPE